MTPETWPRWSGQARQASGGAGDATAGRRAAPAAGSRRGGGTERRRGTGAAIDDDSGTVKIDGTDWFLHAHNPPLRLIVVGAVHIAQALVPFATQCGFADHRGGPAALVRLG